MSIDFNLGVDINMSDYDGRTALHLASSEGHSAAVSFLLEICGADPTVRDRWGNSPKDDAQAAGQLHVVEQLENWTNQVISGKREQAITVNNTKQSNES